MIPHYTTVFHIRMLPAFSNGGSWNITAIHSQLEKSIDRFSACPASRVNILCKSYTIAVCRAFDCISSILQARLA